MRIYIDSGLHISDVDKRLNEIEERLGEPQAVFIEESDPDSSLLQDFLFLFLFTPLLLGTMAFFVYFVIGFGSWIASILSTLIPCYSKSVDSDQEIIDRLKQEYGAEIIPADRYKLQLIRENLPTWCLLNWVSIGVIYWIEKPITPTNLFDFVGIVITILVFGMSLLLIFLCAIDSKRNEEMAETIISINDNFSKGCLIVGAHHHPAIGRMLREHRDVDILNPELKNPGLITRLAHRIFVSLCN